MPTIRERSEFGPYFRHLADLMALKDWTIEVLDQPTEADDVEATMTKTYGRRQGEFQLSEIFLESGEESQRHTATHELIHCHLAQLDFLVEEIMSKDQYKLYELNIEYAVDAIADGWAPTLPLPSQVLGRPVPKRK